MMSVEGFHQNCQADSAAASINGSISPSAVENAQSYQTLTPNYQCGLSGPKILLTITLEIRMLLQNI